MSRRRRLVLTAGAASVAAITGAVTVAGYTDSVAGRFGPLRPVVVATSPIEGGKVLTRATVRQSLEARRIPSRFVPVGALSVRDGAIGLEPVIDLPTGAYIASGILRPPSEGDRRDRDSSSGSSGLHPVEVTIQGAGAITPGNDRFDVLVTPLGDQGRVGRTRVVSRSATIVSRTPIDAAGPDATSARVTLAVPRRHAIRLIDAQARGERMTLLAVGD